MGNDYLTTEKPLRSLLIFSFPMIIGNLFQQFYTMADSAIVGRFVSEQALAAVGASYALTNIFICVAIGGGIGSSVIVSRYFGGRNYRNMQPTDYAKTHNFDKKIGYDLDQQLFGEILHFYDSCNPNSASRGEKTGN